MKISQLFLCRSQKGPYSWNLWMDTWRAKLMEWLPWKVFKTFKNNYCKGWVWSNFFFNIETKAVFSPAACPSYISTLTHLRTRLLIRSFSSYLFSLGLVRARDESSAQRWDLCIRVLPVFIARATLVFTGVRRWGGWGEAGARGPGHPEANCKVKSLLFFTESRGSTWFWTRRGSFEFLLIVNYKFTVSK